MMVKKWAVVRGWMFLDLFDTREETVECFNLYDDPAVKIMEAEFEEEDDENCQSHIEVYEDRIVEVFDKEEE